MAEAHRELKFFTKGEVFQRKSAAGILTMEYKNLCKRYGPEVAEAALKDVIREIEIERIRSLTPQCQQTSKR